MISSLFKKNGENFTEFEISGHAGLTERGKDIACASVSSAVQLILNLLVEFGCKPDASTVVNSIKCRITDNIEYGSKIIAQLIIHLCFILEEFPKTIKITILEV